VVLKQVPDHEHQVSLPGQTDKFEGVSFLECRWFFNINMLPRKWGLTSNRKGGRGRGGDEEALDVLSEKCIAHGETSILAGTLLFKAVERGFVLVADEREGADFVVVT